MTLEEAVIAYVTAKNTAAEFRKKHMELFDTYEIMCREESALEAQLREVAKDALAPGTSASYLGLPVARIVSRTYDLSALLDRFPSMRTIPGLVKEVLDVKTLAGCVKAGLLPAGEVEACKTVQISDYARVG